MSSPLILQTESAFQQLMDAINMLSQQDYKRPLENLSGSTIGQHIRHIIEFYQCMIKGYEKKSINYDHRVRNKLIEESREFAIQCIEIISNDLKSIDLKKTLSLEVSYEVENKYIEVPTTIERELIYNIEHAIHHMALIKIGIKEINNTLSLPKEFGVAASTIRHQQKSHVHSNLLTQI